MFEWCGLVDTCSVISSKGLDMSSVVEVGGMFSNSWFKQPISLYNVPSKFVVAGTDRSTWKLDSSAEGTLGSHYYIESILE